MSYFIAEIRKNINEQKLVVTCKCTWDSRQEDLLASHRYTGLCMLHSTDDFLHLKKKQNIFNQIIYTFYVSYIKEN